MADRGVVELRGPDGRIQPVCCRERAGRVRAAARTRMATARTDLERLAAADDYAAAAAAAAARGGVDPGAELERAVRVLWAVGEALTGLLAGGEGGGDG